MKETGPTVLLVEDQAIIALNEKRLLEEGGYGVITVHTGEKAVEAVRENPSIALILMDIDLGKGMDGTEAARQILGLRNLPIVFLSNHSEREYVERVKQITRYGYVLKNAGEFVLREAITTAFELHKANTALREREMRLQTAERLAQVGGWELDLATGQAFWSDQFFRICGYEPGSVEPTAELGFSLIHPDDRERARAAVDRAIETGQEYNIEKRIVRTDGTVREVHSVGEVITDDRGVPSRLMGSFLDMTERKEAEREREEYQAMFEEFMDHLPGAAFLKNGKNELLYCNPTYAALLGTVPEKLINTGCADDLPPELIEQYARENKAVIDESQVLEAESVFPGEHGNSYWLTYKFPVRANQGRETLLGGISIDITGRKEAEQAWKESEARFQSVFENSPVSLWVEDFSEVKRRVDELGCSTPGELTARLQNEPNLIEELASNVRILDVNTATVALFEAATKDELLGRLDQLFVEESLPTFQEEIVALFTQGAFSGRIVALSLGGRTFDSIVEVTIAPACRNDWSRVLVSVLSVDMLSRLTNAFT